MFFALRTSWLFACPPWSSSPSTYERIEGIWRSPSSLAITSALPSCSVSEPGSLSNYRVRTHARGKSNAAVRVSERDTNRNPLGGVCLSAHFGCVCCSGGASNSGVFWRYVEYLATDRYAEPWCPSLQRGVDRVVASRLKVRKLSAGSSN